MLFKRFFRLFQLINVLSLDIVLNSLVLSWMIGFVTGLKFNLYALCLMGMAIWCIYTLDHLLDAYKNKQKFLSIRHLFHRKYFHLLLLIVMVVVAAGIYGAMVFLPYIILLGGLAFGIIVGVYLLYCFYFNTYFIPKEIIISVVFTCGLWMPYLEHSWLLLTVNNLFLFSLLLFTVLNNLILFAAIDLNEDKRSNFDSVLIRYSFLNAKHINLYIILVVILLFSINIININALKIAFCTEEIHVLNQGSALQTNVLYICASIICLVINLVYILIHIYASHPIVKYNFRIIADNLFLLFIFLYFV